MPGEKIAPSAPTDFGALIQTIARCHDRAAFATLFDHFAPRIKTHLLRFGTPASTAEELAQETMLMVWRKAETFDAGRASPSAWIFAIARNQRVDALRRSRRDATALDPSADAELPMPPDALVAADERDRRVREALNSLPAEQASIIVLSFFDDRPHGDIAQALGLPLGTVKSRVRLGLKRLRELLGDLI